MFQTKRTARIVFAVVAMATARLSVATPTFIPLATVTYPVRQNLVVDSSGNVIGAGNFGIFELSGPGHQTLTMLANGSGYATPLVTDSAGDLYSTSVGGGAYNDGTIFELSGANHQTMTTLYTFSSSSPYGINPSVGLAIDSDRNLCGATTSGAYYKLSAPGYQTMSGYPEGPGALPYGTGTDLAGNFFAVTQANTIIEIPSNFQSEILLHVFNPGSEGSFPQSGLTTDAAGNSYGTLETGGLNNAGGVFELSGANHQTFTILTSFATGGGSEPDGGITIDANGNLWGTTDRGGLYGQGTVYELSGPNHQMLTTVYNYDGFADNSYLEGGLTPDSAGNLYGQAFGLNSADIFELTNTGFSVPEPASLAMVGIPAALALLRRRRVRLVQSPT